MEVLNRPVPNVAAEVAETDVVNDSIDIGEITREEINSAQGDTKSGKLGSRLRWRYGRPSES